MCCHKPQYKNSNPIQYAMQMMIVVVVGVWNTFGDGKPRSSSHHANLKCNIIVLHMLHRRSFACMCEPWLKGVRLSCKSSLIAHTDSRDQRAVVEQQQACQLVCLVCAARVLKFALSRYHDVVAIANLHPCMTLGVGEKNCAVCLHLQRTHERIQRSCSWFINRVWLLTCDLWVSLYIPISSYWSCALRLWELNEFAVLKRLILWLVKLAALYFVL